MLKIKDNVDLKELEKFGFEKMIFGEYKKIFQNDMSGDICIKIFDDKMVYPKSDLDIYNGGNENEIEMHDFLYDLIQAGLVEKVDN